MRKKHHHNCYFTGANSRGVGYEEFAIKELYRGMGYGTPPPFPTAIFNLAQSSKVVISGQLCVEIYNDDRSITLT